MKLAVINFSGNVGKSTVARHLLLPRMPNASFVSVETINADNIADEATASVSGDQFGELIETLTIRDNVVIDVGASNVEDFMTRMTQYRGSHEELDYFVIPTVSDKKQLRDTIATIHFLSKIGVDKNRIRVVLNFINAIPSDKKAMERELNKFKDMADFAEETNIFTFNPKAAITQNDFYGKVKAGLSSVDDILSDTTDYKALIAKTDDIDEKMKYSEKVQLRRLAAGVKDELDVVFEELFR